MKFLAHRGLWECISEKNSHHAFLKAAKEGFGIETDVRDCCGRLVISHDMPSGDEMSFEKFLSLYQENCLYPDAPLALNIKADGMAEVISTILSEKQGLNAFVFDMSVPDMRGYFDKNVPVFTRMSEVEVKPVWLDKVTGVWLDCFESEWFDSKVVSELIDNGLTVCVVSPELHGRDHMRTWKSLKNIALEDRVWLCTDFPREAREFFSR